MNTRRKFQAQVRLWAATDLVDKHNAWELIERHLGPEHENTRIARQHFEDARELNALVNPTPPAVEVAA